VELIWLLRRGVQQSAAPVYINPQTALIHEIRFVRADVTAARPGVISNEN